MDREALSVAEEAARAGGAVIARYFRDGVAMRSKATANLVSDCDLEAERAVVAVIRRTFPGHEVLGEELHAGDPSADDLWVIDPLDGTANFAHRVPQFAVSVAYYPQGRGPLRRRVPPDSRRLARRRPRRGRLRERPARPTRTRGKTLAEGLVGVGFYYDRAAAMEATLAAIGDLKRDRHVHGVRRFGAASLDLCMVGLGQLIAFFEFELSPWDFAAGRLFVEEAGGKVTTCQGRPAPDGQLERPGHQRARPTTRCSPSSGPGTRAPDRRPPDLGPAAHGKVVR